MNSIGEAMCLLTDCGQMSSLKKEKIKRRIRKDARKNGWSRQWLRQCDPEWQWRICTARLTLGYLDWEGWHWRNVRGLKIPFDFPKWTGKKTGRLLVFGEQGLGDELLFATCLSELRDYAETITVETEPRIAGILRRTFPDMHFFSRIDIEDGSWAEEFDAQVPIGDLPTYFRRSQESFPVFRYVPDPERVAEMRSLVSERGWATGISWKGRQGCLDPKDLPEGVSLQYGESHPEIEEPPIDLKDDIEGVFALCHVLDRVVTVPTTVAHLSAFAGTKTDVVMPPRYSGEVDNACNWRWGLGRTMPWHDTATIYRSLDDFRRNAPG